MSKNPKPQAARGNEGNGGGDFANLSFEDALEQVEAIIERIEQGEIGLEQSLAEYERGVKLVAHCRQIHKHAVQRVDELTQRLLSGNGGGGGGSPDEGDSDGGDSDGGDSDGGGTAEN